MIDPEFRLVSYDAGHILGSSSLELTISENGAKKVVVFSGDIGRYDQPILNDPVTPPTRARMSCCANRRMAIASIPTAIPHPYWRTS